MSSDLTVSFQPLTQTELPSGDLPINFQPLAQTEFPMDIKTPFTPPDESKDSRCCRAVKRVFEGLLCGSATGGATFGFGMICSTVSFMWPIATGTGGTACVATTFRNYLKKWCCCCCKKKTDE